jgi:ferrous iron transport protein C
MASLIQIRDLLALRGTMDASQLSQQLATPLPLVNAMLARLEAMGKAQRRTEDTSHCLGGGCKSCPEGKTACLREVWSLSQPV